MILAYNPRVTICLIFFCASRDSEGEEGIHNNSHRRLSQNMSTRVTGSAKTITTSISCFHIDEKLNFSVPPCSVAVQDRLRLPLMTARARIDVSVDRLHHFSYSEHAQSLKQRIGPSTTRRIIECAIYESVSLYNKLRLSSIYGP